MNFNFFLPIFSLVLLLHLGSCTPTSSDEDTIVQGTITDQTNNTIPDVSVTSNTGVTTTTSTSGMYQLDTDLSGNLTFSKRNWLPIKVDIDFRSVINLQLKPDVFATNYFSTAQNQLNNPNLLPNSVQPTQNITAPTPTNSWYTPAAYSGAVSATATPWYVGWSYFEHLLLNQNTPSLGTAGKPIQVIDAATWAPPLNSTITWSKDTVYLLDGFVFVDTSITLRIQAGTIIQAKAGLQLNASALIITRGAKIEALGTAAEPIVFTFEGDDGNNNAVTAAQNNRGKWGGLIILGDAIININNGEASVEGIPTLNPKGRYGGNNDNDNSGILQYVSIRHGGTNIGADNEINGLTLAGVGSGTTIDHVEVIGNADDGFEWFGGNVNTKYLISAYCADDGFDSDAGYRGKNQFLIVYQDAAADKAGEHDGAFSPVDARPFSTPEFWNVTAIGNTTTKAVTFRANSGGAYQNSIFVDFGQGVDIEYDMEVPQHSYNRFNQGDLVFKNSTFYTIGAITNGNEVFTTSVK